MNFIFTDVCLKKLLSNQIVIKIELKAIHEKLKRFTESEGNINDDGVHFTNLECIFPIQNSEDLNEIENQIKSSGSYKKKLVRN